MLPLAKADLFVCEVEYVGEDMDNAQVGISIGLAVKGLSKISELKKGFEGLKGKIAETKKP